MPKEGKQEASQWATYLVGGRRVRSHTHLLTTKDQQMSDIDFTTYVSFSQDLSSLAGKELSNQEFRVLHFVLQRTLRFGKTKEKISYKHFMEGVIGKDGEVYAAPVPVARRSLPSILKSLQEKGLIEVTSSGDYFGTNLIHVLLSKLKEFLSMCALKISKKYTKTKKSTQCKRDTGVVQKGHHGGCKRDTSYKVIEEEVMEEEVLETSPSSGDNVPLQDKIESIKSKHISKRKKTLEKKSRFTKKAFRETWNAAVAEYARSHGNAPVATVSPYDAGKFFNSVKSLPTFSDGTEWKDYITDVVLNWDDYVDHFMKAWGNNYDIPMVPCFPFFLKLNAKQFAVHYAARKTGQVDKLRRKQKDTTIRIERQLEKERDKQRRLERHAETLQEQLLRIQQENKMLQNSLAKQFNSKRRRKRSRLATVDMEELEARTLAAMEEEIPEWEDK